MKFVCKFHNPCKWGELGLLFPDKKSLISCFWSKNELTKTALAAKVANFLSTGFWFWLDEKINFIPFCLASPEIIGVKVNHRQTDKFFDNIFGGMWIFLLVKFARRGIKLFKWTNRQNLFLVIKTFFLYSAWNWSTNEWKDGSDASFSNLHK